MNKRGLTLIEILISFIILALVIGGLANLFISGKNWILHSRSRMGGGELGKLFLDPLQMAVRQDTWTNPVNPLWPGVRFCDEDFGTPDQPNCPPVANRTLNNILYDAQYNITAFGAGLRRVVIRINWTEPR